MISAILFVSRFGDVEKLLVDEEDADGANGDGGKKVRLPNFCLQIRYP